MRLIWRNRNGLIAWRWTGPVVVKVQHQEQMELHQDRGSDNQDMAQWAAVRVGLGS
jgi:hypothetical protein